MREEELSVKSEKSFWEGRAAITCVIAVTAFLCFFTVFEIFVIKMEWNLPVMRALIGGSENFIFSQYREEEEQLELSTENETEEIESALRPSDVTVSIVDTETLTSEEQVEDITDTQILSTENIVDTESMPGEENTVDAERDTETEKEELLPYYIKINRQQNVITIYEPDENGEYTIPVKAILCSTGLYNATPRGVFHLSSKYIWRELHGGVYGQYASRITGGVLFHSVPYASKNKSTLYWDKYNKLGQQASMGCVRLTVEDAKWIYDNCPSGIAVEVYDSEDPGPLGKPETLKLDKDNVNKGWDPTDPDEKNPWHEWSKDG
ncbi:MAG: L,D-transpeptidase [Roseburia sp.]|nr:L,D-transpeptidase [Roseburia sp.]